MTKQDWIVIPNWEKFQHYKDRDPPWIKLYTELLNKPEWLDLTYAQRGLLTTIWLTYARHRGRCMVKNLNIGGPLRRTYVNLEALNDAGFIEVRASTREERVEKGASALADKADKGPDPAVVAMLHDQLAAWTK